MLNTISVGLIFAAIIVLFVGLAFSNKRQLVDEEDYPVAVIRRLNNSTRYQALLLRSSYQQTIIQGCNTTDIRRYQGWYHFECQNENYLSELFTIATNYQHRLADSIVITWVYLGVFFFLLISSFLVSLLYRRWERLGYEIVN